MSSSDFSPLMQVNTRVWLTRLSRQLGRQATLDDLTDAELGQISRLGIHCVWFLSVWQTGEAGRTISRTSPELQPGFRLALPDLTEDDIPGSGFAITEYRVHDALGGDAALKRLRKRMARLGLKLMLDFVPNHTAIDHRWVNEHPEWYIQGTEQQLQDEPWNYCRVSTSRGHRILAYGRDPNYHGWTDVLQLDYSQTPVRQAMCDELKKISVRCDAVRCDMAMLLLPDVFERTWGRHFPDFWYQTIRAVRQTSPGFYFLAEVYWDLEWEIQQLGFDSVYDKRLYDRLRGEDPLSVRSHLQADVGFQLKLARFLENHDEERAARVFFPEKHFAAAAITYLTPGMKFFQQGQREGWTVHVSPHLGRAPEEPEQPQISQFYDKLFEVLREPALRTGRWKLLPCAAAWEGNRSNLSLVPFVWSLAGEPRLLVCVNDSGRPAQGYIKMPGLSLRGRNWQLRDQFSDEVLDRTGEELDDRGLYQDVPQWHAAAYLLKPFE